MQALIPALVAALVVTSAVPVLAQQDYPAAAVIRGENIWLRIDPAEDTEIVGYLQRGDQIRVTDDATSADGDEFYPVEVVETGETGWVRDLAVDPRSLTVIEALPEVVVDEPASEDDVAPRTRRTNRARPADVVVVDEPTAEEDDTEPARRNNRRRTADEVVVDAPAVDTNAGERPRNNRRPETDNAASTDSPSFSGTGVDVTELFTLEPGRYRVIASIQPSESDNFIVQLLGPGDYEEVLFNEIIDAGEQWEGETSVRVDDAGEYAVEVDAPEDNWTVVIEPI